MTATSGITLLPVGRLQLALRQAARVASRVDTRSFELGSRERMRAELLPAVEEAMVGAIAVLDEILAIYDQPADVVSPEDTGIFNMVFDEIVEGQERKGPRQRIADVTFVARGELVRKRESLRRSEGASDEWALIAACSSACRRVTKAVGGVERVLSQVEGKPSVFGGIYRSEALRALETRAVYQQLFDDLSSLERRATRRGVARSVRLATTGLAYITNHPAYEDMRIEDRRMLRVLQERMQAWLHLAEDEQAGQRLLDDLAASTTLLMSINQRAVLLEHDREVLERLLSALDQPGADKQALYRRLVTIRGRDEELDRLIAANADLSPELWLEPVERVLAALVEQLRE